MALGALTWAWQQRESWDAYTMLLGALGFIRDQGIGEDPTGARGRWYVLNR